jgi:hypothetical protein
MTNIQAYSLKELKEKYDPTTIHYIIDDFRCKRDENIETFVKNDMIKSDDDGNTKSYFIIIENDNYSKILGFFVLKLTAFPLNKDSEYMRALDKTHDNKYGYISTYYIVYLARCDDVSKEEISGDNILNFAIEKIDQARDFVAGNIVTLDAKINKVCEFYKSYGFCEIHTMYDKESTKLKHFIMVLEI